jgi:hypothetical protein
VRPDQQMISTSRPTVLSPPPIGYVIPNGLKSVCDAGPTACGAALQLFRLSKFRRPCSELGTCGEKVGAMGGGAPIRKIILKLACIDNANPGFRLWPKPAALSERCEVWPMRGRYRERGSCLIAEPLADTEMPHPKTSLPFTKCRTAGRTIQLTSRLQKSLQTEVGRPFTELPFRKSLIRCALRFNERPGFPHLCSTGNAVWGSNGFNPALGLTPPPR